MHKNNFSMRSVWPNLRRTFSYTYQQKYLQSEKIQYQRKVEATRNPLFTENINYVHKHWYESDSLAKHQSSPLKILKISLEE